VDVDAGLKQKQILADAGSDESSRRYREWCERREASIRAGERMQFDIFNPSEAEDAPSNIEVRIESAWPPERERAPYGPRLGVLVHTVLRDVSFTADCSAIERLARAHARLLGAGEDEILAAAGCVERALSHPLLRRASAAECCRRELPVALRTDGGRIMEGIIDMAFLENGRWTILDFKTDADIERKREHYERQLRWYGHALARLAGAPVTAVLLAL
jgi:ATP-dependent exoDNAse (exonuclease V) beta subunit